MASLPIKSTLHSGKMMYDTSYSLAHISAAVITWRVLCASRLLESCGTWWRFTYVMLVRPVVCFLCGLSSWRPVERRFLKKHINCTLKLPARVVRCSVAICVLKLSRHLPAPAHAHEDKVNLGHFRSDNAKSLCKGYLFDVNKLKSIRNAVGTYWCPTIKFLSLK